MCCSVIKMKIAKLGSATDVIVKSHERDRSRPTVGFILVCKISYLIGSRIVVSPKTSPTVYDS